MSRINEWSEKQAIEILTLLAMNAGNIKKTLEEYKAEHGKAPTSATVAGWRDRRYADEYARIRDEYAREFEAEAIRTYRDRMRQAADVEMLAIQRLAEALESNRISVKDLAPAAGAMSRIKASNADQLLTLTGRPTQIIDDRSAEQVIQGLVRKKVLRVVRDESEEDAPAAGA